jgi:extracellular elastinolytic metalloproteinase
MVLIDRGNCSFVTKVHNVEKVYGRAAIIINNNEDDVRNIIMSDDGTGEDITIPAVLINKRDGDVIKKFYFDNQNNTEILDKIILSINFDLVR